MDVARSDIVQSIAGRDKGKLFFVLESPKRKKRKHALLAARYECRTADKIRSGEKVTNSELRRTLAQYGGEGDQDQEG